MAAITDMEAAKDDGFQLKIKYYMQKGAIAIMAESTGTAGHTERVTYAGTVLTGAASVYEMAVGVVSSTDTAPTPLSAADASIETAVNARLNAYAGFETG